MAIIHAHGMDRTWARTIADTPNISVEFCRSKACHHDIRDCLEILGPKRILFGSDQTLLSVGAAVGLYLDAEFTASEQRMVLSENAERIFRLP
jgi:predicted TIM-barrel fold metal-dependent hydrolase